jgi:nicotinate-nucleotide--dimethylbenzimidazole phosphoribosyltransferase
MSSSHGSVPAKSAEVSGSADAEGADRAAFDERLVTGSDPIDLATESPPAGEDAGSRSAADDLADDLWLSASAEDVSSASSAAPATREDELTAENEPRNPAPPAAMDEQQFAPQDSQQRAQEARLEQAEKQQDQQEEQEEQEETLSSGALEIEEDFAERPPAPPTLELEAAEANVISSAESPGGATPAAAELASTGEEVAAATSLEEGSDRALAEGELGASAVAAGDDDAAEEIGHQEIDDNEIDDEEIDDVSGLIIEGEALSPEAVAALDMAPSATGVIDTNDPQNDEFLRRVLPPVGTPPPFRSDIMTSAGGSFPGRAMTGGEQESQERTVISQPPSAEVLAAMAPPRHVTPPAPAPFGSFAPPPPRGGVHLSVLQLGGLLLLAAAGGGVVGTRVRPPAAPVAGPAVDRAPAAAQAHPAANPEGATAPTIAPIPPTPAPAAQALPAGAPAAAATPATPATSPAAAGVPPTSPPAAAAAGPTRTVGEGRPARRGRAGGVGRRAYAAKRAAARKAAAAAAASKKPFVDPFE